MALPGVEPRRERNTGSSRNMVVTDSTKSSRLHPRLAPDTRNPRARNRAHQRTRYNVRSRLRAKYRRQGACTRGSRSAASSGVPSWAACSSWAR